MQVCSIKPFSPPETRQEDFICMRNTNTPCHHIVLLLFHSAENSARDVKLRDACTMMCTLMSAHVAQCAHSAMYTTQSVHMEYSLMSGITSSLTTL